MGNKYQDILKYYVIGYDFNENKVYRANIFNNVYIYTRTVELIEKYLEDKNFEEFHKDLTSTIKHEMWSRFQYEISVNEPFPKDLERSEKIDFFYQFEKNSYMVARFIIDEVERLEEEEKWVI